MTHLQCRRNKGKCIKAVDKCQAQSDTYNLRLSIVLVTEELIIYHIYLSFIVFIDIL